MRDKELKLENAEASHTRETHLRFEQTETHKKTRETKELATTDGNSVLARSPFPVLSSIQTGCLIKKMNFWSAKKGFGDTFVLGDKLYHLGQQWVSSMK